MSEEVNILEQGKEIDISLNIIESNRCIKFGKRIIIPTCKDSFDTQTALDENNTEININDYKEYKKRTHQKKKLKCKNNHNLIFVKRKKGKSFSLNPESFYCELEYRCSKSTSSEYLV